MSILKIIKIVLIGLFISCGKGKSEEGSIPTTNSGNNSLNFRQMEELLKVLKSTEPLFEIKFYCEKTGGRFSQYEPICSCPPNKQFVGQGIPGCYSFNEIELPLEGRERKLTKSDSKDAYPVEFTYVDSNVNRQNYSVLWKPYIHVPKEIALHDLKQIDVMKMLGYFDISNEPDKLGGFNDVFNPLVKESTNSDLSLGLYDQIKSHIQQDIFIGKSAFQTLQNLDWKQIDLHSRKCLVHCEFIKEVKNPKGVIRWVKEIRGGQVFRQWLTVKKANQYFNDFVVFLSEQGPAQVRVSSVMKIQVNKNQGKIENVVSVFQNSRARTFKWDLLNNISHKEIVKKDEIEYRYRDMHSKILLCDSDIQIEQLSSKQREKLALFESSLSESFFGSLKTKGSSVRQYLDIVNANSNGVLHTSGNGHASSLLKFADDQSVVPLALFPCLNLVDQWATQASVKGVKVVNLSAADEVHNMNACRRKQYTEKIQRHGLGFLWVMSADNWSRETTAAKSTSCPQKALNYEKNVIIASHPKMEYGAHYVDVIVGRNSFARSSSASESTMIISQIANDLFDSYPKATPAMVKKALILGADYDEWIAYKSRAGGELNISRSRNILKSLIRKPFQSNEKLVKKHFGYFDDEEGKLKHIQEYYQEF